MTSAPQTASRVFGPFSRILEKFPDIPVRSHFSGLALARHFPVIHLTGIDNSGAVAKRFPERRAGLVRFVKRNVLDCHIWPKNALDLTLLANATLNSFTSAPDAWEVVRNRRDAKRPDGSVAIVAFREVSLERFVQLRERCDAVPFEDRRGDRQLIRHGVGFAAKSRKLRHNCFIEAPEGDAHAFPGAPGIPEEQVWTSREVRAMAENPGLAYEGRISGEVAGGGAHGWPVGALVYCAQA
ncbi:hypothetical protein [Streptomyces herbicida]|uniref:hypothetical protein n=1 Tax=Streptomyces herbicida TaxID=3065675 RepID=UPI0029300F50|nr:hypothetical protein [Streptomyces sp. NEAU-HV9]